MSRPSSRSRVPGTRAVGVYRWLLFAYPADFRGEYGREMALVFGELHRDASRRRGAMRTAALVALWARTIADLAWSAPREHMDTILQDVRYAARMMLRERSLTIVAVLALALGSGANTAIFSIVDGVLLKPLPFPEPDRLVRVEADNPSQEISHAPTSFHDYTDWKNESGAFSGLSFFTTWNSVLLDSGEPERLPTVFVSYDFITTFGVTPIVGRTFLAEEDVPGAQRVVIVGEGFWKRRYGGDPSMVGRTMRFTGGEATVVGIVPDAFKSIVGDAEIWMPLAFDPALNGRGDRFLMAVGRLQPGITLAQADEELSAISARLESDFPKSNKGWGAAVVPMMDFVAGDVRPALLILLGAVGLVLLIACANVGNLLLARAAARGKEVALRTALGATRARLVRQFLTESVLLYALGAAVGLAVAAAIVRLLIAFGPEDIPRLAEASLDLRALAFTFGVSLAVGLVFGIAPALRSSRSDLADTLKEAARGSGESFARNRLRGLLVVSEIAFSLVLLAGAGLLIGSFARVRGVDPGFNPDGAVVAQVALPPRYDSPEKRLAVYDQLFARLGQVPGMRVAGGAGNLPLGGGGFYSWSGFIREGEAAVTENEKQTLVVPVTSDYFRAMEISVKRGRAISTEDRANGSPVIVVNESFANRYFPGEDAVGKRVLFWQDDDSVREIVGVVRDVKNAGLDAASNTIAYFPVAQKSPPTLIVIARSEGDPMTLVPAVKSIVHELDPEIPVYRVRPLAEVVSDSLRSRRFQAALLAAFALLALALASVGVYGVMAYSVARRTNEIGIRMALGATSGAMTRMVVAQGAWLALAGIAIGLGGALALSRVLESFLYGVSATDVPTLAAVSALLGGVAVLACYIPARRASRIDPVVALRHE
jgi:putative ABC transport system permease protein